MNSTHNFINSQVTGLTVSYDSRYLLHRSVGSVRDFHPEMQLIIIEGSPEGSECREYARTLTDQYTQVVFYNRNIGHGQGMHEGIRMINTRFALIFDTDTVMLKSPIASMVAMAEPDTYGIGYIEKTGLDGFEYGSKPHHKGQGFMWMLHPFFHLLAVNRYWAFQPYVHHGAPCYKAAKDIHTKGLTEKIIKVFPDLHHTSGKGWTWEGTPSPWVQHDTAGTRILRRNKGLEEIERGWIR